MKNYIIGLLLIASCNSDLPEAVPELSSDTANQQALPLAGSTSKTSIKLVTGQQDIMGVWAIETKEPITVEINQDSIYYTEHFESHPYKLQEDSIFISYPDFIFAAKVYLYGDTLVMRSDEGEAKFVRFNN